MYSSVMSFLSYYIVVSFPTECRVIVSLAFVSATWWVRLVSRASHRLPGWEGLVPVLWWVKLNLILMGRTMSWGMLSDMFVS